jgi:unsaturated chondroitin disaccharide hydrolase
MRASLVSLLLAAGGLVAGLAGAAPRIKVVKIGVTNPGDEVRPAENVVLRVADLRAVAPDLTPSAFIVTATEAATLEEDARVWRTRELPSQADDLDGDGKLDEIVFQLKLGPHQTRIVTLAYGDNDGITRLRAPYPPRTRALFAASYAGPAWESELYAWRFGGHAIDLFGKRRPGLDLDLFAAPGYDYHVESPMGRDIADGGDAFGIGSVAAWVDGVAVQVGDVAERNCRVVASGPVRGIVDVRHEGWKVGGTSAGLTSRIVQWAGERGFVHQILAEAGAPPLVTGLPRKHGIEPFRLRVGDVAVLGTWGPQVVEPGAGASRSLPDQNLGLAVFVPGGEAPATVEDDGASHLLPIALTNGRASWYVLAAWDQEGSGRLAAPEVVADRERGGPALERDSVLHAVLLPPTGIHTREGFTSEVSAQARRLALPATVAILSKTAAPEPAPPDTLVAAPHKTFKQAIDLLRQSSEATATRWLPRIQAAAATVNDRSGDGYFMEANPETGEWTARTGYNWTGSFWVGVLWHLYDYTKDARFREWAEAWNAPMLGQEPAQNHDTGFLNYYGSAFSFDRTKDPKYRDSVLRSATRLREMFHPKVGLIPRAKGSGATIIDTMINLEVLWWAARTTGDASWRDLAHQHAQKSMEWLIRPDGSVTQGVQYPTGDGAAELRYRSQVVTANVPVGQWAFKHTNQGFAADTSWSRGVGWALYGFARAYQETGDPAFLETARRVGAFITDHLPEDGVPWSDYVDEGVHFRNRDTSAAAINAAGFLHLADAVAAKDRKAAQAYRDQARAIVQSLVDHYLTPVGPDDKAPPGYLRHGCGTAPQDGALIFGHYYLLEALVKLAK